MTAPAVLKVDLAVRGARLDSSVRERGDLFTAAGREGPVTSLGLVLPDDLCVTVPIDERSPFVLVAGGSSCSARTVHTASGLASKFGPSRVPASTTGVPAAAPRCRASRRSTGAT
jgi:hypothetical protein